MGIWNQSNTWFFGSTRLSNPNGISIGSAVFAQLSADVAILYNGPLLSPKIAPSNGTCRPQSNTWFLGPTGIHIPNGVPIGSVAFAGLTTATDRQTIPLSCNHRPHLRVVLRCGLTIYILRSSAKSLTMTLLPNNCSMSLINKSNKKAPSHYSGAHHCACRMRESIYPTKQFATRTT